MKDRFFRIAVVIFVLLSLPLLNPVGAVAKQEVITVTSRYDISEGGKNITLSCLLDMPDGRDVTAILLVIPWGNGRINLRTKDGKIIHDVNNTPFIRNTALLHERAIGLAMPDVPSDRSKGINVTFRKGREHADDLKAVLKDLRTRYPKARIYFATSGSGAVSALFAAGNLGRDLDGIVLTGADSSQVHAYDHSAVRIPVLMMHHAADSCDASPFIEAKELADRYAFTLVPFSGGAPDKDKNPCLSRTKHGLFGLDGKFVETVGGWITGQKLASPTPGQDTPFLNERVAWVPMTVFGGEVRLQTTLYTPDGPGPFPLAIINHGIPFEKVLEAEIQFRHRYCLQSEEFVKRGFAVVIPMRRGYGKSSGGKNLPTINIAAFGLQDAQDIQATANDSYFSPTTAKDAHEAYKQNGGQATFLALPPFKKDGHGLFADFDGRAIWVGEVEKFLSQIGLATGAGEK